MASLYFSGQGKVYAASRQVGGDAAAFNYLGNCSAVKVSLETQTVDHKESYSGNRVVDQRLVRETKAMVTVDMEEFLADNLAMGLYGVKAALTPGAQANEAFPNPVAIGNYIRTKFPPNGAALTIKDSAGSPITLVAGTDYTVINAKTGLVQMITIPGTQPYKFTYTPSAGVTNIPIFGQPFQERWIRVELVNTADPLLGVVLVELYKTVFDPIKDLDLIGDDFDKFQLSGEAYFDSTKVADAQLGQFGRLAMM
jgi:hypothetical protein